MRSNPYVALKWTFFSVDIIFVQGPFSLLAFVHLLFYCFVRSETLALLSVYKHILETHYASREKFNAPWVTI